MMACPTCKSRNLTASRHITIWNDVTMICKDDGDYDEISETLADTVETSDWLKVFCNECDAEFSRAEGEAAFAQARESNSCDTPAE